jgi:hypothetical protein
MVPWGKRLLFSALSVLIVAPSVGICSVLKNVWLHDAHPWGGLAYSLPTNALGYLFLSYLGWVGSVPMVLLVKRVTKRSFVPWLIAGGAIGPLLVTAFAGIDWCFSHVLFPSHAGHPTSTSFNAKFLYYVAVPVSFFSAVLYLLWILRAQRILATTVDRPVVPF